MLLPIKNIGGQQQIAWSLPRVAPSQLKLLVPQAGVEADVSAGATLLPPVAAAGGSEITVLGLGGELRMSWHLPDARDASRGRLLEAEGSHFVRIERGLIRTQAQFAIRSLGGDLDRVRVRLPRGARLLPDSSARGYTTRQVDANPKKPAAGERPLVEIQPDKPTRGPLNIQLACEQSYDVAGPKTFSDLATFEVEGAARNWGSIAVQVVGDWHLFWQDTVNVRRVDAVPATLPAGDLTAAFEYSGQPYRLAARVAPPVTRVAIEPQYVMEVSADGPGGGTVLKLDARLKCRVSGAKIFEIPLDLAGWEIPDGSVGPASRVDVTRLPPAGPGPLKIPLVAPLKGEFEIAFSARRRLAAGQVATTFPRPLADSVVSATVVVLPDDNVQLTPQRDAMSGLAPLTVLPAISLPPRAQAPYYYRAEKPEARLVADVQVHGRAIAAESSSAVRTLDRTIDVRQTIQFDVSYEAVEWLSIRVPRELAEPGVLHISLAGKELVPLEVRAAIPGDFSASSVEWRLPLPKPRIGNLALSLNYQVPIDRVQSQVASQQVLPLVVPVEAKVRRNELILESDSSSKAQIADANWSRAEESAGTTVGQRYLAKQAPQQVILLISSRAQPATGDVVIQRGWVQSWFSGKIRHDQAAYLFRSREDHLQIELPAGAEQGACEVLLDGKSVVAEFSSPATLTVGLPSSNGLHLLLLRYRVPRHEGGWLLRSTLPKFSPSTWVQKLYWQLVLPPDALLLGAPGGTTPEYLWQRQGWTWQRQSSLDERQLASWIGLSDDEAAAPAAAQRYLLSISDTSAVYRLSIIPRAALVLASAGTVLCLGLLLIYARRLRHPGVILALLSVILLGALFYPEPAVVAGQAAVLGLLLILLVVVLRKWLLPAASSVRTAGGRPTHIGHSSTEFVQSGSASAVPTGSTRDLPTPAALQSASGSTKAALS